MMAPNRRYELSTEFRTPSTAPPCPGLHLVEASRKPLQRLVGQLPDDPQGVVLAHPLLRAEVAEHRVLMKILSSHRENNTTHLCFYRKCSDRDFFSTLLGRGCLWRALRARVFCPNILRRQRG